MLPIDVEKKIKALFNQEEIQEAARLLESLWAIPLNVGEEQLARAILVLSEGDLEEVQTIFKNNFYGDPRDLIMMAEAKCEFPGHCFTISFEEMERQG